MENLRGLLGGEEGIREASVVFPLPLELRARGCVGSCRPAARSPRARGSAAPENNAAARPGHCYGPQAAGDTRGGAGTSLNSRLQQRRRQRPQPGPALLPAGARSSCHELGKRRRVVRDRPGRPRPGPLPAGRAGPTLRRSRAPASPLARPGPARPLTCRPRGHRPAQRGTGQSGGDGAGRPRAGSGGGAPEPRAGYRRPPPSGPNPAPRLGLGLGPGHTHLPPPPPRRAASAALRHPTPAPPLPPPP